MPFIAKNAVIVVGLLTALANSLMAAEPPPPESLAEKARRELTISPAEKTLDIRSTPATVRSTIEPVESPISYTAVQMGLSVQSFTPHGQGEVVGQDPVSWNNLGSTTLTSLDFRWLPYQVTKVPGLFLGGFTSFGYGAQNLAIRSPAGKVLDSAKLHSAKWSVGLAAEYNFAKIQRLSLVWTLGAGQLHAIQSSSSSFANSSRHLAFTSSGFFAQLRIFRQWKVYLGYDYRMAGIKSDQWIGLQRDNYLLGFLGSLN